MDEGERRQFMAEWEEEALPRLRDLIANLVPDLEVDGGPANAADAATLIRHMFTTAFDQYWREAVPPHIARRITEGEKADAREIILRILDREIAARGY